MLERRHLSYFIAVAEELNFSRAAARLQMSQPPLSAVIRQLEVVLGTPLLQRTTREVRLTDAGAVFLPGAERILAELDHTVRATRRTGVAEGGPLRIAYGRATRFETLPRLGRRFHDRHPEVDLVTEEMWNARMPGALRLGSVDAAISVCPELVDHVVCEPVRDERVVALLPFTHRLAEGPELALADLEGDEFMLLPRELGPRLHDTYVGLCRGAGFEPRVRRGGLQSGWELEALAERGLVSLAPESVSLDLPARLTAVPLAGEDRLETALLTRAGDRSPPVGALRRVTASWASAMLSNSDKYRNCEALLARPGPDGARRSHSAPHRRALGRIAAHGERAP
jgi:DNA-binding transcriptional LysR family regulator